MSNDFKRDLGIESGGGGGLPIMGNQREAPPERGTFSGFRYMKGQGFTRGSIRKFRETCYFGLLKGPKELTDADFTKHT